MNKFAFVVLFAFLLATAFIPVPDEDVKGMVSISEHQFPDSCSPSGHVGVIPIGKEFYAFKGIYKYRFLFKMPDGGFQYSQRRFLHVDKEGPIAFHCTVPERDKMLAM